MKYFIANWKANKNLKETNDWLNIFTKKLISRNDFSVIICPPYPLIPFLKEKLGGIKNVFVGSQDISMFEEGSYTGEVTAKTMAGLVSYSIIGHSERRKFLNETNEVLFKKIKAVKNYGIEPIFCIRDEKDPIPDSVRFVAYEPVYAIGTGMNESAEKIMKMKKQLKIDQNRVFIYGGSVNEKNAIDYLKTNEIDGFLVGKVSLDPEKLAALCNLA